MQILFTAGHSWFSRTIQHVLDEPVSHVAIQCGETVIHSNLLGVHVISTATFHKHATVILRYNTPDQPQKILDALSRVDRSMYDFGALLFLGFAFLARRYLHVPLPKMNLWQATGMYLCTELVTEVIDGEADSLTTPYGLFKRLVRSTQTPQGSAARIDQSAS